MRITLDTLSPLSHFYPLDGFIWRVAAPFWHGPATVAFAAQVEACGWSDYTDFMHPNSNFLPQPRALRENTQEDEQQLDDSHANKGCDDEGPEIGFKGYNWLLRGKYSACKHERGDYLKAN